MATPDYAEHFRKLKAAHEARQQRKMLNIDVVETSGVQFPAHLTPGWVVMKSADAHDHRADALYLEEWALKSAEQWGLQPGQELSIAEGRSVGKSTCGCVYMRTPETVSKAASDAWVASYQEALTKKASGLSPEEIAYFEAETKRIQP